MNNKKEFFQANRRLCPEQSLGSDSVVYCDPACVYFHVGLQKCLRVYALELEIEFKQIQIQEFKKIKELEVL